MKAQTLWGCLGIIVITMKTHTSVESVLILCDFIETMKPQVHYVPVKPPQVQYTQMNNYTYSCNCFDSMWFYVRNSTGTCGKTHTSAGFYGLIYAS